MKSNRTQNPWGISWIAVLGLAILVGCETGGEPPRVVQPPEKEEPAAKPEPAQPKVTTKKAAVGVGKKGRDYGQGPVATPAAIYWGARERIVFDIEIPKAMQLFKAQHDRAPKSHEEFMEVIIKANHIKLPELLDNESYRYDPEKEELMVDRVE